MYGGLLVYWFIGDWNLQVSCVYGLWVYGLIVGLCVWRFIGLLVNGEVIGGVIRECVSLYVRLYTAVYRKYRVY